MGSSGVPPHAPLIQEGPGETESDRKSARRVRNVGEVEETEPDSEGSADGDTLPCLKTNTVEQPADDTTSEISPGS